MFMSKILEQINEDNLLAAVNGTLDKLDELAMDSSSKLDDKIVLPVTRKLREIVN